MKAFTYERVRTPAEAAAASAGVRARSKLKAFMPHLRPRV